MHNEPRCHLSVVISSVRCFSIVGVNAVKWLHNNQIIRAFDWRFFCRKNVDRVIMLISMKPDSIVFKLVRFTSYSKHYMFFFSSSFGLFFQLFIRSPVQSLAFSHSLAVSFLSYVIDGKMSTCMLSKATTHAPEISQPAFESNSIWKPTQD